MGYGTTTSIKAWKGFDSPGDWTDVWPEAGKSSTISVSETAADFYLLELIGGHFGVDTPGFDTGYKPTTITPDEFFDLLGITDDNTRKSLLAIRERNIDPDDPVIVLDAVRNRALGMLDSLVDKHVEIFREYLHLAIGGELRHHQAVPFPGRRSDAWSVWRLVFDKYGVEAVEKAAELFREFPSGSGYGGEPWAQAADVLAAFEAGKLGPDNRINRRFFLDRVWTLEHNNGCILNKVSWDCSLTYVRTVLDAHASHPPDFKTLWTYASADVKDLWSDYVDVCNMMREIHGFDPSDMSWRIKLLYRCVGCGHDTSFGHSYNCPAVINIQKYGATHSSVAKQVNEDNIYKADWLPVGPDGVMRLEHDRKVRCKITVHAESSARGLWLETTDYVNGPMGKFAAKTVQPKKWGSGPVGELSSMEFRVSIYDLATGERIARAYDYLKPDELEGPIKINVLDWLKRCTPMPVEII